MLAASHFSFLDSSPSQLSSPPDGEEHRLPASQGTLTERQEEIAQMVARGRSCNGIAGELQVPVRAVEGHLYRILDTLGLSSMKDLTDDAIRKYRTRLESQDALQGEVGVSEFLTVAEIAMSMRVSKMTVYRLIQSGALESVRFGRSYRVTHTAVQRYIDSINITGTH